MTLEQFHNVLEKAIGPCKLNIIQFEKKKNLKMKDFVKGNTNIYFLDNENLGNIIKHWKGNFINQYNSCFKDSFIQSLVHSMAETLVKKEEEFRKKKGLPVSKNFKDYDNNSSENTFWKELLEVFDIIKTKVKNKDSKPIYNLFDSSNHPSSQNYASCGNYIPKQLSNLSNSSTNTSSNLPGGSLTINIVFAHNDSNKSNSIISMINPIRDDHEIYLNKKTIMSDSINIDVRSFLNCIFVIINIIMNDFLNSNNEKSFNGLLKYYYMNNNFGNNNKKTKEFCKNCKTCNLEYYNRLSTLPEVLIAEFDLSSYYNNHSDAILKEDSFYWALQEEISLEDYYDFLYDNYCHFELTSFIAHCGNKIYGHFINFSKIDNIWYLFDDLSKEEAKKIGNFQTVKTIIEKEYFGFIYKGEIIKSKLKICTCFYEKNKCKGYENYIEQIKKISKNVIPAK